MTSCDLKLLIDTETIGLGRTDRLDSPRHFKLISQVRACGFLAFPSMAQFHQVNVLFLAAYTFSSGILCISYSVSSNSVLEYLSILSKV